MKSLFKISSRYVLTAALITLLVLTANIATVFFFVMRVTKGVEDSGMGRYEMENIEKEMAVSDTGYVLSEKGYELISDSACLWAMRLNGNGKVVWNYQLPTSLNHHYTLSDVSLFSRWYLDDYPVFTWKNGEELMVYGVSKNVARFDFYGNLQLFSKLPQLLYLLVIFNLGLISILALLFGFRFYHALRPVAKGIEQLSVNHTVQLPEKGIVRDLTRQINEASLTLQSQNEQLKKRDQARTDWISGVSHDVRTPLSLIMGFSDDLAKDLALTNEQQKKAELIREQSQQIKDLIADLNLTVKLEYQSQPLRKERICPARELRELTADYYNQNLDERFQILPMIEKETEKAVIFADRQLLLRVFRNLIGNSIKHNPEGCEIKMAMSQEYQDILLLFSDSGEGIPSNIVQILEGKKNETAEIHIMGLRIVMQIVKAHQGTVTFCKDSNSRYRVLLTLPLFSETKDVEK